MNILNKITNLPQQTFFLTGNAGQVITLALRFLPSQNSWIMDLSYGDFQANGIAVVASPNLLRNYRNIIPFGMACFVTDGLDPYYIDDFSSQRVALYLMDATDVQTVETQYFND